MRNIITKLFILDYEGEPSSRFLALPFEDRGKDSKR